MNKEKPHGCIICGSKESRLLFSTKDYRLETTGDIFAVHTCSKCGLFFVNPMPREEDFASFYPNDYYQPNSSFTESAYSPLVKRIFRRVVGEVTAFKKNGKSLDIGCGTGEFMNCFSREGFDAYGTDISENAGNALPDSLKLKITTEPFLKTDYPDESFDVITLKQVLEHFLKPGEVLREVHRILRNNGVLYVEVPNTKCLESRLFKQYWYNLEVPRHLYHFNLDNFNRFFNKNGFEELKILEGSGIMAFRTPLALINSLNFYLRNRSNKFFLKAIPYVGFFPLLILTFVSRFLSPPTFQTDIRVIFRKKK